MTDQQTMAATRYARMLANRFQCAAAIIEGDGPRAWQVCWWHPGDTFPVINVVHPNK